MQKKKRFKRFNRQFTSAQDPLDRLGLFSFHHHRQDQSNKFNETRPNNTPAGLSWKPRFFKRYQQRSIRI
jgi:hypothetical protein